MNHLCGRSFQIGKTSEETGKSTRCIVTKPKKQSEEHHQKKCEDGVCSSTYA